MALRQLRNDVKRMIQESPSPITRYVPATVSDGFGGLVADPNGAWTTVAETVRISHEKVNVQDNGETPVGLSTSLGLFVLAEYTSTITEGEILGDGERRYRVGPVDTFERFGGAYQKQAPIDIVSDEEVAT